MSQKPLIEVDLPDKNKFTQLLKRLGAVALPAAAKSLYESAEMIMADSKENYVPVDQGTLRSTGYVKPPELLSATNAKVELGYGGPAAPYAVAVHENPRAGKTGGVSPSGKPYKHWARTGGWKYLETPIKDWTSGYSRVTRKLGKDLEDEFVKLKA